MVSIYKFVSWDVPALENYKDIFPYRMAEKYNKNIKLTREEKNKLANSISRDGCIQLMGWQYDFRNSLKNYVVKQYGRWSEYWAPDKTSLRKAIYGRIDKIVEVA